MLHPCGYSQWRAEGIYIGSGLRAEMGLACERNHFKRPYLPDYVAYVSTTDKKNSTRTGKWLTGIVWMLLTVIFEFITGLSGGNNISELIAAYNPLTGNLWLLVLAVTLLSPVLTGFCMRKTDDDHFAKVPVK